MNFDPTQPLTRDSIKSLPPLCADGAWGTELQKLGVPTGKLCDRWNVEHPDRVASVAQAYVDAGSQIIITNTFSSNRILLEKHGLADEAVKWARAGAEISKRVAAGKAYVFASIGPCGKLVMMGEAAADDVETSAAEQAEAMADGGADAILIETQSDLAEAEAALKGALRVCDLPVGLSFTFDSGKEFDRTMMGASIAQTCELAREGGASFVGANCGVGISTFPSIAAKFRDCGGDLPIWVKGNAGLPKVDKTGATYFEAEPQEYGKAVGALLEAGARFIGGCCGSTPEHIKAIALAMREAANG